MPNRENFSLPAVKRARGYRVYAADGTRYIDFYLNGGRALTGHRPNGALQVLKSTAERGLWAEYPGAWRRKADRLLQQLYPEVEDIFYFPTLESALQALRELPRESAEPVTLVDTPFAFYSGEPEPASCGEVLSSVVLRRPFALTAEQEEKLVQGIYGPYFIPLIPFPGRFLPVPLCRLRGVEPSDDESSRSAGLSEPAEPHELSPILYHLLIKSVTELQRFQVRVPALTSRTWSRFDLPGLQRCGPYLKFGLDEQEYIRLQSRMMENGVLLPPDQQTPAVIPAEFTDGEVLPLIRECKEQSWKR